MKQKTGSYFHIGLKLVCAALIIAYGFYVNRAIVIKGLYMDDLYMWSCYGEQNIWEFAFPIGTSTRFRPVYWLATYLQMAIIGSHVSRFAAFNIVVNVLTALELSYFAKRLASGVLLQDRRAAVQTTAGGMLFEEITGLVTAVCYLASRFAYYQIGQALGLMETMALAMSTAILYLLLVFSRSQSANVELRRVYYRRDHAGETGEKGTLRYFYGALLIYFLLAFTHERYICLLPLFFLALIIRNRFADEGSRRAMFLEKENLLCWIMPVVTIVLIIAIRTFAIGKALPAGTGGTQVTDTFNLSQTIRFGLDQVLYVFGVNAGPEYLCGIPWEEFPVFMKRVVKLSALLIAFICWMYLGVMIYEARQMVRRKDLVESSGRRFWDNFSACFLFGGFPALCIGASSVTIRLEMRWIYASYAAALLFAAYMLGAIRTELFAADAKKRAPRGADRDKKAGKPAVKYAAAAAMLLCFVCYGCLSVTSNTFCRGYFTRLYFWPDQLRMNSLAEQTVEKYGTEGVFGKNIYILENNYNMSDFYGRTFFKTFDPEKTAAGTTVIFVENEEAVPAKELRDGHALVLKEVPEENAYLDITDELKQIGK